MYHIEKLNTTIRFDNSKDLIDYANIFYEEVSSNGGTHHVEEHRFTTIIPAIRFLQESGWDIWEKLS